MDKELKKDIKLLLFLDSLISSSGSLTSILDEVEEELEDLLGKGDKGGFNIEKWFKDEKKEK